MHFSDSEMKFIRKVFSTWKRSCIIQKGVRCSKSVGSQKNLEDKFQVNYVRIFNSFKLAMIRHWHQQHVLLRVVICVWLGWMMTKWQLLFFTHIIGVRKNLNCLLSDYFTVLVLFKNFFFFFSVNLINRPTFILNTEIKWSSLYIEELKMCYDHYQ